MHENRSQHNQTAYRSLFIAIATVAGISYAVAQPSSPDPGHSASEIGPGTFDGNENDVWNFPGKINESGYALLPQGVIVMWSGSIDNIPGGWHLCDGTSGTPDLRDRFIVGAGSEYEVGATGGEKEHTLTIDEIPSYSHTQIGRASGGWCGYCSGPYPSGSTSTGSTGGDQPHENRPPYYALCYIMKL
jgi:hypothetical protein